jgi:membrane protein YqaA with SNARE-associated domain
MVFAGLFFTAWLAATIVPFSSEVAFTGALLAGYDPVWCLVVASLGNCAGATTNYVLGRGGATWFAKRFHGFTEAKLAKYHDKLEKAEIPFMLCAWLPVIGDPITFYLGIAHVRFGRFALFVFLPRIARYAVILALLPAR